jgi:hypothetical protein
MGEKPESAPWVRRRYSSCPRTKWAIRSRRLLRTYLPSSHRHKAALYLPIHKRNRRLSCVGRA